MAYPRFADAGSLIAAIQQLRHYLVQPVPPSLEMRDAWLKSLLDLLVDKDRNLAEQLSREFEAGRRHSSKKFTPRGLSVIISPRLSPLRLTLERLFHAIWAGNAVLVKFSSRTPEMVDELSSLLSEAGVPDNVVAIGAPSRAEISPFLISHPAVRAVSFVGQLANAAEIAKAIHPLRCQFQAWTGGSAAWAALDEVSLNPLLENLAEICETTEVESPFFPRKIFVLDSFLPVAKEKILSQWSKLRARAPVNLQILQQMTSEGARVLAEGSLTLVENLPNCSELQQQELPFPILQLISVKYPHEIGKWINNASQGYLIQLWGDEAKAMKLSEKFEVGRVTVNTLISTTDSLLFGVKESAIGLTDRQAFGLFWSEVRELSSKH